ncbi:hypothetical protein V4U86_02980 [Mycobacterium sp. AMU20-3851]|uniref:hypothetical protein n=1 Tax=Mycobacterium sp. AMU20-3851 TaxID=3122055 RepID=UPI00375498AC
MFSDSRYPRCKSSSCTSLTRRTAKSYADSSRRFRRRLGAGAGDVQMDSNILTRADGVPSSSPETGEPRVLMEPPTRNHAYPANGRELIAILAVSGIIVSSWALFPSTVESGTYVPLPELSAPRPSVINHAELDIEPGSPLMALTLNDSDVEVMPVSMAGSSGIRYASSAIDVTVIPIRSKLEALLSILYAQSDELDQAELEAKIQALLKLPDSVLVQLLQHPDLVDLNIMLDSVFYGTSDVGDVKAQLDKVDVASVPGTSDQVQVVKVSGNVVYAVRTPAVDETTATSIMAAESVPVAPGGAQMTVTSQFDALAGVFVSTFTAPPPPPPPPAAPLPMTMMVQMDFAPALVAEPSSVELASAPSLAPEPTHSPTPSVEPTRQASDDITFDNKIEPGGSVQQAAEDSLSTSSPEAPATQSSSPSTPSAEHESSNGSGAGESAGDPGGGTSSGSADSGGSGGGSGSGGSSGSDGGGDA